MSGTDFYKRFLTPLFSRSGLELSAQVNDGQRIDFHDVFALPESGDGVFAVVWPADGVIQQNKAWGRKLSEEADGLLSLPNWLNEKPDLVWPKKFRFLWRGHHGTSKTQNLSRIRTCAICVPDDAVLRGA